MILKKIIFFETAHFEIGVYLNRNFVTNFKDPLFNSYFVIQPFLFIR